MSKQLVKESFSRTERLLLVLGIVIVAVMAYSFIADVPLISLFMPNSAEKFLSTPIGTTVKVEGRVLRQRTADFEFKPLTENMPLYPNDTVMTGPNSTAVLSLNNGRKVELTPNSLIKLTSGAELSDGVRVDVLRGSTSDNPGKVVPLKGLFQPVIGLQPTLSEPFPAPETKILFTAQEAVQGIKKIELSVKIDRSVKALDFQVSQANAKGEKAVVATAPATITEQTATASFDFRRPGSYEWSVLTEGGDTLASYPMTIGNEAPGLETFSPKGLTTKLSGELASRRFTGVVLLWKRVSGSSPYRVRVFKEGAEKPVFEKLVRAESRLALSLKDLPVLTENAAFTYLIDKVIKNGFVLSSGPQPLRFELAPPSPTFPENSANIDQRRLFASNNAVFLTWTRTNYTPRYQIAISSDPEFKSPILDQTLHENFFALTAPTTGQYYWKVRSEVEGRWTEFSETRSFIVR